MTRKGRWKTAQRRGLYTISHTLQGASIISGATHDVQNTNSHYKKQICGKGKRKDVIFLQPDGNPLWWCGELWGWFSQLRSSFLTPSKNKAPCFGIFKVFALRKKDFIIPTSFLWSSLFPKCSQHVLVNIAKCWEQKGFLGLALFFKSRKNILPLHSEVVIPNTRSVTEPPCSVTPCPDRPARRG